MNTYTERAANKLNALLEKNYDAEKGYKKAAENADSANLKSYFNRKAQQRYDFGHELKSEIAQFGQSPDKGDSLTSKAHRAWMDIKAAFSADDDEAMLEEAIRGEKASVDEYEDVLEEAELPSSTQTLLRRQKEQIYADLHNIKRMEDLA